MHPMITHQTSSLVKDHTLVFDLEPLYCIILCNPLMDPNTGLAPTTPSNTV
ncbi:hypothetical protein LINPERHAP2_LOCUS32992, partial [Linum perenne]